MDPRNIKHQMVRDSSWGTFMDTLEAAENCCGTGSLTRWRQMEPNLTNKSTGKYNDELFSLEFSKDNFDFKTEGVDHFISTIAGDIVLNPLIGQIQVDDFNFNDESLFECFPGPNIGIKGLYDNLLSKTLKGDKRPILAFTVKPRMGLSINDLKNLERALKRKSSPKGRQAEMILKATTNPIELEKADIAFGRSAPTWADFEFLRPVLNRADAIN